MTKPGKGAQPSLRDLKRSLPMELLKAREAAMARFRPMLRTHSITEQQWRVIRVLADIGTVDTSKLAELSFLLAPSLSRILQTLIANDWVQRTPDTKDSRRSFISLSPKGRLLFNEIAPKSESLYNDIECEFGPDRLDQLYDLLAHFYQSLERRDVDINPP